MTAKMLPSLQSKGWNKSERQTTIKEKKDEIWTQWKVFLQSQERLKLKAESEQKLSFIDVGWGLGATYSVGARGHRE